jgi:DNA-binding transcriptional regulator YiaG
MKCPNCGATARQRKVRRYAYRESGLDSVVLHGGVTGSICPKGHSLFAIQGEQQLLQVIALFLIEKRHFLSGQEVRFIRKVCEITQTELARAMHLNRRETIAEWESDAVPRRSLASEFLLRAVLLETFKEVLKNREGNHLALTHMRVLHAFEKQFAESYKQFLEAEGGAKTEIDVRQTPSGNWIPKTKAA